MKYPHTASLPETLGDIDIRAKTALLARFFAQARSLHFGAMLLSEQVASVTEREELLIHGQRRLPEHRWRTLRPGGFDCRHYPDLSP